MTSEDLKICSCCKKPKLPTEFHKHVRKPDGLSSRCRDCAIASSRKAQNRGVEIPREVGSAVYEVYDPSKDRAVYRNDGLKHILSRGVRC